MGIKAASLNRFVAALVVATALAAPAWAQDAESSEVDRLLTELAKPDQPGWQQIEDSLIREWSKSGSPAMDLLLKRGMDALESGEFDVAIEHLSALVDHAPDFAEGWNARATAFFQIGEYGLAVDDIRHVLALNPNQFGALSGLAILFEELGYDEDALEAYRAVEAIHPHRTEIREAIERLEKSVEGVQL